MALNPATRYPGQTTAPSAAYPYGSARNITVPGDGTGTPWEKDVPNDIWGFLQALLDDVGETPTGDPDEVGASQYLDAIKTLIANAKDAVSLQAAYLRSVALSQIAPHIDVGTALFQVGGTADAMLFRVVNSTQTTTAKILAVLGATTLGSTLGVTGATTLGSTLTIPTAASLLVTGAGAGGVQKALVQTSGVGGEIELSSGSWTPVATIVSGSGVATGDLINTFGRWSRVGSIVTFAFHGQVQTSGWASGLATMGIPLPVSTTHASNDSLSATFTTDNSGSALGDSGDGLRARGESGTNRITLLMNFSAAFVGGAGTANISVTGMYRLT